MDNGTRDAIVITLTGILANFFWHIVKHSWRACFGYSGGESYVTELKLKHNEQRDISLEKLLKERDDAREERDGARKQRDEARDERDKARKDRDEAFKDRDEAFKDRDEARNDRNK
ncbi:hypothetical protein VE02_03275 [Pseudogymnoascus sp. 03VT05]|nr:hypothetical protein VE02_03275 [Pseudogymnoascus sp. 03VT05]